MEKLFTKIPLPVEEAPESCCGFLVASEYKLEGRLRVDYKKCLMCGKVWVTKMVAKEEVSQ